MNKLQIPQAIAEVGAWLELSRLHLGCVDTPIDAILRLHDYASELGEAMKGDTAERLERLERDAHPPLDLAVMLKGWRSPDEHYARINELITANNRLVDENRALKDAARLAGR
jgi:hypothetical protein